MSRHQISDLAIDTQFFDHLPVQGLRVVFTLFDFSAWDFPHQTAGVLWTATKREDIPAISDDNCGHNLDFGLVQK